MVVLVGCGAGAGGGDDDGAGARGCVPGEAEPVTKAQGSEGEPTGIVGRDGAPVGRDGALVGCDVALFGAPALVVGRAEGPGLDDDVFEVDPLAELFGGVVPLAGGGVDGRAERPVLDVDVFEVVLAELPAGVVALTGAEVRGEAFGGWALGCGAGDVGDGAALVLEGDEVAPLGCDIGDAAHGAALVLEGDEVAPLVGGGGATGGDVFAARVVGVGGAVVVADGLIAVGVDAEVGDGAWKGSVGEVAGAAGVGAAVIGAPVGRGAVGVVVVAAEAEVSGLAVRETTAVGRVIVRRCSILRSQSSAAASLNTVSSFGSGSACWNMYVRCVRLTSDRAARSLLVIFFASRQRSKWRMTIAVESGSTPTIPRPRPSRSCSVGRSVGASSGKLSIRSSCWGSIWTRSAASSIRRSSLAIQCFTSPRNSTVPMPPR